MMCCFPTWSVMPHHEQVAQPTLVSTGQHPQPKQKHHVASELDPHCRQRVSRWVVEWWM